MPHKDVLNPDVARRRQGAWIIARMMMDIAHAMRSEPAYRRKQGLALGPMFVLFAIRVGEAEGKPLGATDISEMVKIPRSSVQRYAQELVKRKIVKKTG